MINIADIKAITFEGVEALQLVGATTGVIWQKEESPTLPYTLIDGILSTTGAEYIDTGVSWQESCVWEITCYCVDGGKIQYGYTAGGVSDVRNQASKYQLGSTYNPLAGTDAYTSATSKYTFNVDDIATKTVTATLDVQGVSITLSKENSYFANQNFRIGQQLYASASAPTGMVIQEIKRFVGEELVLHNKSCIYQDQIGMWDMLNNAFVANSGGGEYAEVASVTYQLLALSVEPRGTAENQNQQLLAIGVE